MMQTTYKTLKFFPSNTALRDTLKNELGISRILAQLLVNRGITNAAEAQKFLNTDFNDLLDPYSFSDMPKAVDIIKQSAGNKKKVMIFGDYDADGVTSVALLKATLSRMGIQALHYIPHRIKEGYGLSKNISRIVREAGADILVTVDCGTNSNEQIRQLRADGIDVVVTDHHEQSAVEPCGACAVINPKARGSTYKYSHLAGVGVAYKLCQALSGNKLVDDLDMVSLGTIADVVPLNGENRIIAKIGLSKLSKTSKVGLQALMENCRIKTRNLNSTSVSFILGPRINASGRMDTGETAFKLLMSDEASQAQDLAKLLDGLNRQRQKVESKIIEEALCEIEREVNFKEHKIIVIANEGWHQGVLGIVASKLADRFYRPAIVISLSGGLSKGSGRSIKNFHLFNALLECKEFLNTFGGHSHAVGLVIDKDNVADFRNKINLFAKEKLTPEDLIPSLDVDMELEFSDLNECLTSELELLEPFGMANPEPVFFTRNLALKGTPQILGKDTIKFWVTDGKFTCQAIGFGKANLRDNLMRGDCFNLVYNLRMDSWQGQSNMLLEVKDMV